MKTLFTLFSIAFFLIACTKEVGKKPYMLELTFDSGEVVPLTVLIYEKAKKYDVDVPINTQKQTNSVYIESEDSPAMELVMYKQNENRLIGINDINSWYTNAISFAGGQEVKVYGVIELDGPYTKKGKKFIVENGTFSITWTNSQDYGEPYHKVLNGTWRMERK